MNQFFRKCILLFSCFFIFNSLSVDPYDLLNGQGLFHTQSLESFSQDHHHHTSFLLVNSSNILKLQKPASSQVSFDSGLQYRFAQAQPRHISFEFSSISPDAEDANFRLIDSTTQHTVLLFRAGKAGFIRVNENQMIQFYNSSVSTDVNVKTVKMDILLDWNSSSIKVFVNEEYKGQATFFQSASKVDKLRLYNLYQSTSYWKNIVVCSQNCYSFNSGQKMITGLSTLLILLMLLFY